MIFVLWALFFQEPEIARGKGIRILSFPQQAMPGSQRTGTVVITLAWQCFTVSHVQRTCSALSAFRQDGKSECAKRGASMYNSFWVTFEGTPEGRHWRQIVGWFAFYNKNSPTQGNDRQLRIYFVFSQNFRILCCSSWLRVLSTYINWLEDCWYKHTFAYVCLPSVEIK